MKKTILAFLLLSISLFSQEIRRPTAEADTAIGSVGICTGIKVASSPMPNAYDASGDSTYSTLTYTSSTNVTSYKIRLFSGFAAASTTYYYTQLRIKGNCSISDLGNYGSEACAAYYSLNNGSTWTTADLRLTGNTPWTFQIDIPNSQDLTQIKVAVCVQIVSDHTHNVTATQDIYDIRTEGTTTPLNQGSSYVIIAKN